MTFISGNPIAPQQGHIRMSFRRQFAAVLVSVVAATSATSLAHAAPGGGVGLGMDGSHPDAKTEANVSHHVMSVDRVVAIVNDNIILNSELDARLLPAMADTDGITDPKERARRITKLTTQILDEMINEELIVHAAEAVKIDVEATEVTSALEEIKKQNNLDDTQLAQALAQQGYTISGYKQDLRRQLMRMRAINQMVRPKVVVTDDDVRARYDQMARRSEAINAVRLSHILIKLPDHPTEQQLAAARTKAGDIVARAKRGEDFVKLAAEVSDDDATKATGGELGWFERGSISADWESIVFSMDKGDVRGPVTGPTGLHVFLVSDTKRADMKSFAELKDSIKGDLTRKETEKQTNLWIEDLRKKAYIDIKLEAN